jgi:DNA polymerase-3 subunit gamma/tau
MVGQEHVAKTLKNAIASQKIGHGYLFTGTRGVGKTSAARILAKALNCTNPQDLEPCGECDSCKSIDSGSAMDVLEIDGASNRGVEDIRELREQVKYAPMNGRYKVYIIDEVHMLTKEAFNALLKTLEEPPAHVVFLFATTEIRKVPPTILSRVQRFDFKRITEQKLRDRLAYIGEQENMTLEEEALDILSRRANGSMRDALSLLDQVYAFSGTNLTGEAVQSVLGIPPEKTYEALLEAIESQNKSNCFSLLEEALSLGVEVAEFLSGFGSFLRNVLFARQEGLKAFDLGLSEERFAHLQSLSPSLREGDLIRYSKVVSDVLLELKQVAHPRLAVEMGLVRLASLDRVVDLSQLLGQPVSIPEGLSFRPATATESPAPEKKNASAVETLANLTPSTSASPVEDPVETGPEETADTPLSTVTHTEESTATLNMPSELVAPPDYIDTIPIEEPDVLDNLYPSSLEESLEGIEGDEALEEKRVQAPIMASTQEFVTHWDMLIQELMDSEPLIAGQFQGTQIQWNQESPYVLEVLFDKSNKYDVVHLDPSGLRTLEGFLGQKLEEPKSIRLKPVLQETQESRPSGQESTSSSQGTHRPGVTVDRDTLLAKEPMIAYAMELFQGDLIYSG